MVKSAAMRLTTLVLAIALAACAPVVRPAQTSSSTTGVVLDAERLSATSVRLQLRNGSADRAGYNLCTSALERRDGASWTAVRTDEACTMELRILEPGGTATFEKTLPSGLAAGEYRYVARVDVPLGQGQVTVASDPFRVD